MPARQLVTHNNKYQANTLSKQLYEHSYTVAWLNSGKDRLWPGVRVLCLATSFHTLKKTATTVDQADQLHARNFQRENAEATREHSTTLLSAPTTTLVPTTIPK